jgi:hypothetical protein
MTSSLNPYSPPPVALRVPRASRPCTWRGTVLVSAFMYLAGRGRRPARREGVTPGGTAGRPGFGRAGTRADGAAGAASDAVPAAPFARAVRYAALGVASALAAGSPAASGAAASGAGAAGARASW